MDKATEPQRSPFATLAEDLRRWGETVRPGVERAAADMAALIRSIRTPEMDAALAKAAAEAYASEARMRREFSR